MTPSRIAAELRFEMPAAWKVQRDSLWARTNTRGHLLGCFLEGPSFDRQGNLHLVDVPFGRIFRVDPAGRWELVCNYDGWPNGLKIDAGGRVHVADYRRGIIRLEGEPAVPVDVATSFRCEGFLGCNDLFFANQGDLWFTDQGQTGLHNPAGRVFRLGSNGHLACVLDNIPSPNGLVMNLAETQIYIAVTRANAVWRLPLMEDGTTSKVGLFIQLSGGLAGPDGLALDEEGGLIVAHPGIGVWRFDKIGRPTHLVECPDGAMWTNIAFGGSDNTDLYIVDSMAGAVYVAHMPCAGRRLYSHAN